MKMPTLVPGGIIVTFCSESVTQLNKSVNLIKQQTSDQLSTDQAGGQGARLQRLVRGGDVDALQRSSGTTITSSKNENGWPVSSVAAGDTGASFTHWTWRIC